MQTADYRRGYWRGAMTVLALMIAVLATGGTVYLALAVATAPRPVTGVVTCQVTVSHGQEYANACIAN